MALASLFKQLVSERILPDLIVRPFIVDHRIRPESENEAYTVANRLEDLGKRGSSSPSLVHLLILMS